MLTAMLTAPSSRPKQEVEAPRRAKAASPKSPVVVAAPSTPTREAREAPRMLPGVTKAPGDVASAEAVKGGRVHSPNC